MGNCISPKEKTNIKFNTQYIDDSIKYTKNTLINNSISIYNNDLDIIEYFVLTPKGIMRSLDSLDMVIYKKSTSYSPAALNIK